MTVCDCFRFPFIQYDLLTATTTGALSSDEKLHRDRRIRVRPWIREQAVIQTIAGSDISISMWHSSKEPPLLTSSREIFIQETVGRFTMFRSLLKPFQSQEAICLHKLLSMLQKLFRRSVLEETRCLGSQQNDLHVSRMQAAVP